MSSFMIIRADAAVYTSIAAAKSPAENRWDKRERLKENRCDPCWLDSGLRATEVA